ncbi:MAG: hypothetical protein ACJ8D5_09300 [Sphingomicrobium sp.]
MRTPTFEDGYREGWMSVAGEKRLPERPTRPPEGDRADFQIGFFYGRSDALERCQPHT